MRLSTPIFALSIFAVLGASFAEADPFYAPGQATQLIAPPPAALPPVAQPRGTLVPGSVPMQQETYYGPADEEIIEYHEIQPYAAGPIELYRNVVYRDQRRIAPGAVPYLVEVPLPQPRRARGCVDCGPTCALIEICVPPCKTPCVKVRRRGYKLRYDFGKYEVDIVVRRTGKVIVDYDA